MWQNGRDRTASTGSTLPTEAEDWGRHVKGGEVPFPWPAAEGSPALLSMSGAINGHTSGRSRLNTAGSVGSAAGSFGGGRERFDTAATLRRLSFDVPGTPDSLWARSRAGSKDFHALSPRSMSAQQSQLVASQLALAQYLQQALPTYAESTVPAAGLPQASASMPPPPLGQPPLQAPGAQWNNALFSVPPPYGAAAFNGYTMPAMGGLVGGAGLPLPQDAGVMPFFQGMDPSQMDLASLLGSAAAMQQPAEHVAEPFLSTPGSPLKAPAVPPMPGAPGHARAQRAKGAGHAAEESSIGTATTLMLRNIPVKFDREMLLQDIDRRGFVGLYDFFYLPIDFQTGNTVGYAFINLVNNDTAVKFEGVYNWLQLSSESAKICHVGSAKVQGKGKNVEQYRNSSVMSMEEKYHPLTFDCGVRVPFPAPTRSLKPVKPRVKQP
eukprot:TRINITY_DN101806_c0_g1_i1.p1 TRINITY_DN101806_c0_g1~~TRINITY_DN101806_c0_g1_i1.p1  ORF type:complete len:476 (-),score=95.26 TRINITY_DN101806_c0_g1_i1:95-1405(-)